MANPTISPATRDRLQDREIWESLQRAIAASSGFQCWQQEQLASQQSAKISMEEQVRGYLRQTLETLAY
jgi:hypothetical protein